jgi:hypothetical protein
VADEITVTSAFDPPRIRPGIVRGISYGLFGEPGEFVPRALTLGAGLVRAYVYWGQVEPEPRALPVGDGRRPAGPAGWRRGGLDHPCVPARPGAPGSRDNEPSNTGLLWAGTAAEYVTQLKTFWGAVKGADPAAAVVLGGCGYDVFSSEPGSAARQFFDHVAGAGRDAFDLFSAHLYGEPARVPHYLDTARQFIRRPGTSSPSSWASTPARSRSSSPTPWRSWSRCSPGRSPGPLRAGRDPRAGRRPRCTRSRSTAGSAGRCSCSGTAATPSTARTSYRSPSAGRGPAPPPPSPARSAGP